MSRENVDLLSRAIALGNEGNLAELVELYHPDVEVRDTHHLPDVPERLQGRPALVAAWARWLETMGDWTVELMECVEADPWVVCELRWQATGKGSRARPPERLAEAYEIRDGLIVRQISGFADVAAALAAVAGERGQAPFSPSG
jgi:hypothetical protein